MTPNINSPTAKELATKSIVELSCIVYQNALAVKAMIDALDVDALNGIVNRAEVAAGMAEAEAINANGSAAEAYQHATEADAAADMSAASANEAKSYADAAADVLDAAGATLATKLDKVTTASGRARVYAINKQGGQYLHSISGSTEHHNGALPIYTSVGTLRSAAPQMPDDLATKQYVDTFAGGGALDVLNWEGGAYTIPDGRGAVIIASRLEQGTTHVFGVPPSSGAFGTSITSTSGGLTMTADLQNGSWFVDFSDSVWTTFVFI